MMRLLKILFHRHSREGDAVTRRIDEALARNERSSNGLLDTINDLLKENDRITGRPAHARKPRS